MMGKISRYMSQKIMYMYKYYADMFMYICEYIIPVVLLRSETQNPRYCSNLPTELSIEKKPFSFDYSIFRLYCLRILTKLFAVHAYLSLASFKAVFDEQKVAFRSQLYTICVTFTTENSCEFYRNFIVYITYELPGMHV